MPPLLIERAIAIAAEWHDGTVRKGRWTEPVLAHAAGAPGVPVMAHVTAVAMAVQAAGWGAETVAAAFLHDTLEDPDRHGRRLAPERLAALVGDEVVRIVEAVTEPKLGPDGRTLPWRHRKEAYLAHLRRGSAAAAAVSLADKAHNAHAMASSLEAGIDIFTSAPGRQALSAGADDQRWFFEAVLAESARHNDPRLDGLRATLEGQVERFVRAAGLGAV